jgi:Ni,Fe-hydrogenase III small subunit
MTTLRIFHLDTGGCGACAAEVWATVEASRELRWAPGPAQADVVALTGSLTPAARGAALALYHQYWEDRVPIVAIGRCAIDGYPFGRGGLAAVGGIDVQGKVEACPPLPEVILMALLNAAPPDKERRS